MGGLHALTQMVAYVIENRPELLQKSDNKLVCIVIPRGDPRLEQFQQYTTPGPYTDYVNPVVSSTPVKVYLEDTGEFDADAISKFLLYAPDHGSVVPLRIILVSLPPKATETISHPVII